MARPMAVAWVVMCCIQGILISITTALPSPLPPAPQTPFPNYVYAAPSVQSRCPSGTCTTSDCQGPGLPNQQDCDVTTSCGTCNVYNTTCDLNCLGYMTGEPYSGQYCLKNGTSSSFRLCAVLVRSGGSVWHRQPPPYPPPLSPSSPTPNPSPPSPFQDADGTALSNLGTTLTSDNPVLFIHMSNTSKTTILAAAATINDTQFFVPFYPEGKRSLNLSGIFKLFSIAALKYLTAAGNSTVTLDDYNKDISTQLWQYDAMGRIVSVTSNKTCLGFGSNKPYPLSAPIVLAACNKSLDQMWVNLPKVPGTQNGTIQSWSDYRCLDTTNGTLQMANCVLGAPSQNIERRYTRSVSGGTRYHNLYSPSANKFIIFAATSASAGNVRFVSSLSSTANDEWAYNSRGQFASAQRSNSCLMRFVNSLVIDSSCKKPDLNNRWLFSA